MQLIDRLLGQIVFVLIGIILRNIVSCYNLDTVAPIIKFGPNDSYFGFSVAQHSIFIGEEDTSDEMIVLVGAPKDSQMGQKNVTRAGGVYRCPFNSFQDDCSLLSIDNSDFTSDEERDDQWLGATLSSQKTRDGMAVVCAPRNKRVEMGLVLGQGVCISMTNTLQHLDYLEPCSGKPIDKGHEEFSYCQVGMGLDVTKDGEVLLGAPGVHNWKGMVFSGLLDTPIEVVNEWLNSPGETRLVGQRVQSVTKSYSYLGMSVKIGKINGDRTYVVGAPRSDGVGQVLLMDKLGGRFGVNERNYLTGKQFGGAFGYELVIMDFDSDGMDDIVVSAPFEYDQGMGGAIYTYRNSHKGINNDTEPKKIYSRKMNDTECLELDCRNARFGLSLANVGDLDGDGYHDLAVGAPYEGEGAVYIFQGSHLGLKETFTQRITPSQFNAYLPTFGSSISGGMDMDSNGNPDIVVGAYKAAAVAIFRSRPVINVQATMTTQPEFIDLKSTDCKGSPCFLLKSCFSLQSNPKNKYRSSQTIDFELEKVSEKNMKRIYFKSDAKSSVMKGSVAINNENTSHCFSQEIFLDADNKDFLSPIIFRMNYSLRIKQIHALTPGEPLSYINDHPTLNYGNSSLTHVVHFKRNCSNKVQCISNLQVRASLDGMTSKQKDHYTVPLGSFDDLVLKVEVENNEEEAHEAMLFVTLPEKVKFKSMDERGKSNLLRYHSNTVVCSLGNPLLGNGMVEFEMRLDPNDLEPSDPEQEHLNITIFVNTTSQEANTRDDTFVLYMKVVISANLVVKGISNPAEVYFGGAVKGESVNKTLEDVGLQVVHSYEVKNIIKSHVMNSTLVVSWPSEWKDPTLENGKHLLYLFNVTTEGPIHCPLKESGAVNKLNLVTRKELTDGGRSKRDASDGQSKKLYRTSKTGKVVTLECEIGMVVCSKIVCHISDLDYGQSAVVRFFARLWNTTFLQEFLNVDKVRVFSKAEVIVDQRVLQISSHNNISKAVTVVLPDQDLNKPYEVDFWIIILSVCAGILVLILLIFLLWKCGFFRRDKPDEMLVHQAKLINQPLYT